MERKPGNRPRHIHLTQPLSAQEIREVLHITKKEIKAASLALHKVFPKHFPRPA